MLSNSKYYSRKAKKAKKALEGEYNDQSFEHYDIYYDMVRESSNTVSSLTRYYGWKRCLVVNTPISGGKDVVTYDPIGLLGEFPPVPFAKRISRCLVIGSKHQVRTMRRLYDGEITGNLTAGLERFSSLSDAYDPYSISFLDKVSSFWSCFFGKDFYLDGPDIMSDSDFSDVANLPELVIATGEIRYYSINGGTTIDVSDFLKELAKEYGFKLELIDSWEYNEI